MSQADASAGSPLPSAVRGLDGVGGVRGVGSEAGADDAGDFLLGGGPVECGGSGVVRAGGGCRGGGRGGLGRGRGGRGRGRADRGQVHGAGHQAPYGFVARRVLQRDRGLCDGLVVPPLREQQFGEVQPQREVFGSGGDSGPQATDER